MGMFAACTNLKRCRNEPVNRSIHRCRRVNAGDLQGALHGAGDLTMLDLSQMLSAPIKWRAILKKKACLNANQSARSKTEYVIAGNVGEAKRLILAKPENQAFIIESIREDR